MSDTSTTAAFSPEDALMIEALVAGKSHSEVAAVGGVSTQTVYRRLRDPRFRAAVSEGRARLWLPDADRLRREVSKSIDTLVAIRDNERTQDRTRAGVAKDIIELAVKLHEKVDTEPRLAAIENELADKAGVTEAEIAAHGPATTGPE